MPSFPLKILPETTTIQFIEKRWYTFFLSGLMIIATFVLLATRGLNLGIDFTGGILIEAEYADAPDITEIRQELTQKEIGDISIQPIGNNHSILIRIGQEENNQDTQIQIINLVKDILAQQYSGKITYQKVDYVGPKIGKELIKTSALALIAACLAMLVYLWFRFELNFGICAIIALLHDTILTLGFFSLTQLDFNLPSIASILLIIGYSINDTVVIFDRISDNLRKFRKETIFTIINVSMNQNLSRTLITSLTTLMALLSLIILGGEVIRTLSLAIFFGLIVGTYSSLYIASSLLTYTNLTPKENEHHGHRT